MIPSPPSPAKETTAAASCYHCGDDLPRDPIVFHDHAFCCHGCQTVFEILSESELGGYYGLERAPGATMRERRDDPELAFLDRPEIRARYVTFEEGTTSRVSLSVPQIHCSACIWLLENLHRLNPGTVSGTVNFPKRKLDLTFRNDKLSLRQVVELLWSIGYAPDLKLPEAGKKPKGDRTLFYKIGVAGFCFGNIMLLAFPEYLGIDASFQAFQSFFGYITLGLALPVFFYAGWDYLRNAWLGIRQRFINLDIPIALGMIALLVRSSYEVISGTGAGYFDSLSGLVFFLLLGKWFQKKTYDALSFDRDYKSYFPIAVNRKSKDGTEPVKIEDLEVGDRIELRNRELIPADGLLRKGEALIDYSFVTGESDPVRKKAGDLLYAGGRQMGPAIEVELVKKASNSYLTELWNQAVFRKEAHARDLHSISNTVSRYFTLAVLAIASFTTIYWWLVEPAVVWNAVSAVLIVACPCALALSVPFTLGNMTRIMGRMGLYLKNPHTIEKMAAINAVFLDKTGTITHKESRDITWQGDPLADWESRKIRSLVSQSVHPLSLAIKGILYGPETTPVGFKELPGLGLTGWVDGHEIKVGSAEFLGLELNARTKGATQVFVAIDGQTRGHFVIRQRYRKGVKSVITRLLTRYPVHLLTGDNDGQRPFLEHDLGLHHMHFNQSPMDKLERVKAAQAKGDRVLMLGDGLNDAGALKQSDAGIAISDNVHQFSPACDAILDAEQFRELPRLLRLSRQSLWVVRLSFLISFLYNGIGLSFAIAGQLSPITAAILMPLSSITVVFFAIFTTNYLANKG